MVGLPVSRPQDVPLGAVDACEPAYTCCVCVTRLATDVPSFAVASAWPFAQGTLETQPILQFGLPYIQKLKIGMTHAERCTFWNELSDSLFDIADVQTMALETASSRR